MNSSTTTSNKQQTAGQRVVLTRSAEDCAMWGSQLKSLGYTPIAVPCIDTQILADTDTRARYASVAATVNWVVFTSVRGVEAFKTVAELNAPIDFNIACIGAATAATAQALFGRVDLVSPISTAANLADALIEQLNPSEDRILLALAENAPDTLATALVNCGFVTHRIDMYRTIPAAPLAARRAMSDLRAACVIFASPSAVTGFVNQIDWDKPTDTISIGPTTSAALRDAGLPVTSQAATPGLAGVIDILRSTV